MNKKFRRITAVALFAVASFQFISCDNKKSEETSDHADMESSSVVEVPDHSSISATVKEQISSALDNYLSLKNALIVENQDQAKKSSEELSANLEKLDFSQAEGDAKSYLEEKSSAARSAAKAIANSTDLAGQRAELDGLSTSLYSLVKATGSNPSTAYYQHCPMANDDRGGYWISEKKEIANPYFGDKMLKCGENKETLSKKM